MYKIYAWLLEFIRTSSRIATAWKWIKLVGDKLSLALGFLCYGQCSTPVEEERRHIIGKLVLCFLSMILAAIGYFAAIIYAGSLINTVGMVIAVIIFVISVVSLFLNIMYVYHVAFELFTKLENLKR